MKTIYYIPALVAGILSLASCNYNEPSSGGNSPAEAQSGINFNIGLEEATSRTQYSTQDWLQIEWQLHDQISIFCDQTVAPASSLLNNDGTINKNATGYNSDDEKYWPKLKSANYEVTTLVSNTHPVYENGTLIGNVTTNNKANIQTIETGKTKLTKVLHWKRANTAYHFFAGYGAGVTITPSTTVLNKAVAKCKYDPEQTLTKGADGSWTNMGQAYMFSYRRTDIVQNVDLHFKPIMTTVEIDITGPTKTNEKIRSIVITIPKEQNVIYSTKENLSENTQLKDATAYFDYNIVGNTDGNTFTGNVVKGWETDNTKFNSGKDETITFNLATSQSINSSEPLKITAILPPIAIGDGTTATSGNPIKVTVYSTDGSNTKSFSNTVDISKKVVIKTDAWKSTLPTTTENDYVDLGLSVKWAKRNLGASKETDYGDYYGWGCTVPYATSAIPKWTHYFSKIGGTGTQQSDCGGSKDPLAGKTSIANTEYDAAHERLGGNWRMPTADEWDELANDNNCKWEETYYDDAHTIPIWKVTSKKSGYTGKYIYIPKGGGLDDNFHGTTERKGYYDIGQRGYYWTASSSSSKNSQAQDFVAKQRPQDAEGGTHDEVPCVGGWYRYHGRMIRPVYVDN